MHGHTNVKCALILTHQLHMLVLFNSGIQFRACVPIMFTVLPQGVTTLKLTPLWVNRNVWQTSVGCRWSPITMTCSVTKFNSSSAQNVNNSTPFLSHYMIFCTVLQKIEMLTCNSITISSYFAKVMTNHTYTAEAAPCTTSLYTSTQLLH
jgi:hypothetical protein